MTTSVPSKMHILGFTLIELMIVVAIIGILVAIAIPKSQAYVFRSQIQRVIGESGAIKSAVETCLSEGKVSIGDPAIVGNCDPQATGSNLQATAGNAAPTIAPVWSRVGTGVPQVSLSATSASTIVATLGNSAGSPLQGSTITWTRNLNGSWSCRAAKVEAQYVSSACPL